MPFSCLGHTALTTNDEEEKKSEFTFPRIRAGAGSEEEARQLWLFGLIAQQVRLWR